MIDLPGLGARIKEARQTNKASLVKLSERAGLSRQYWYHIESETLNHPLPLETLRAIEEALETSFDVLDS